MLIGLSGGAYNSDSEFYQAKVRVDTGEPFEVSVMGGSHGRWHYLENNDEWAEAFKAGNNAILKTEGWDYETKVVKFNLNNFDEAYNAVVENCK